MNKQMWYFHTIDNYSSSKMKELPMKHATTWITMAKIKNKLQTVYRLKQAIYKKTTNSMILFVKYVVKRQIYRDRGNQ